MTTTGVECSKYLVILPFDKNAKFKNNDRDECDRNKLVLRTALIITVTITESLTHQQQQQVITYSK